MESEIKRILEAKSARRHRLARLPYPEKVQAIIQMQRMVAPLARRQGRSPIVWPTPQGS
jgi:hypothetical protein